MKVFKNEAVRTKCFLDSIGGYLHFYSTNNGTDTSIDNESGIKSDSTFRMDIDAVCQYIKEDPKKDVLPFLDRVVVAWTHDVSCDAALNAYDYEVLDAVFTLLPWRRVITADMIYRVMVGRTEFMKISSNQRESIAESLMKCATAYVTIEIRRLAELGYLEAQELCASRYKPGKHCEPLIWMSYITFTRNMEEETVYLIRDDPLVVQIAWKCGKVGELPLFLCNTPLYKSKQIIMLQASLMREINAMYRPGKSRYLDMTKVVESCSIAGDGTKEEMSRRRHQAEEILNYWTECEFIRGYTPQKQGRAVTGYNIYLSDQAIVQPA